MNKKVLSVATAMLALSLTSSGAFARGGGHGVGHSSGGSHSHASSGGTHSVRSYTKKDGTHVASSHATNPNGTRRDNYSSKGNTNPYTGKEGTKDPSK